MKENAILKINKMGKISCIVTTIAKVFAGIGLAVCLIAGIILAVVPEDFMTMEMSSEVLMNIDLDKLGFSIGDEGLKELETEMEQEMLKEASVSFDMYGASYALEDVSVTEDSMQLDAVAKDFNFSLSSLKWIMLMGTLTCTMTMVTLFFIGALCKAFRNCQSPFEENVIEKMQNLAISLIPWAFMTSITDICTQSFLTGKFQASFGIDLHMVLIILLILVLMYIFKYGAVLQRESDETL